MVHTLAWVLAHSKLNFKKKGRIVENSIKLTALTVPQMAALLKKAGSRTITEEGLTADIEAGCPVNDDGTLSLYDYVAWLVKETGPNASRD